MSPHDAIPPPAPRTPTPPFLVIGEASPQRVGSPLEEVHMPSSDSPVNPALLHPTLLVSPPMASDEAPARPEGGDRDNGKPPVNPFNFQTQTISTTPIKSNIGQRRGHRYKHSSISTQHQVFQELPPRPPPVIPASLPIPTLREAWHSMQHDQRILLYWSLCHVAVAIYVFFTAQGSLAMTALSHLVFFDAGSAAICVAVDVLGNFEVWKRGSVRYPFGLERSEVLAGFAMSILLIFGGFDLVSHNAKHWLEGMGGHEAHHAHSHDTAARVPPGSIDWAPLSAIASTIISAYGLRNHARISKVMRVSYLSSLPQMLSNPFHVLTLSFSFLLLMLPLLSVDIRPWMDGGICALIAVSMFVLGAYLAMAQGLMLLMSYGGAGRNSSKDVNAVIEAIEAEPSVAHVEEAQFWQVHYGLGMANLKLRVFKGYDEGSLGKLRLRTSTLIQNRLGEGYGQGGNLRWEVTLQMSPDS